MAQFGTLGFAIGILATGGILYCLGSRYWQINSQVSSQQVNRGIQSYQGLWVRCMSYIPGVFQCDNYDESYLALPAALQAQRAFMVVAGIFAVAGLVAGSLGQDCIHAIEGRGKIYAGRAGGALMIFSGLLTLAAVSWYASDVIREFWQDQALQASFQYEFGAALYVGWISAGLALISGSLMACCTCSEEYEEDYPGYNYNPSKAHTMGSRNNTEYV